MLAETARVFFEEWDDPLISAIGWVSELIEIVGGVDIFTDRWNRALPRTAFGSPRRSSSGNRI